MERYGALFLLRFVFALSAFLALVVFVTPATADDTRSDPSPDASLDVSTDVAPAAPGFAPSGGLDPVAYDHFSTGAYEASALAAVASGGAENLALAARALNAIAYFENNKRAARRTAKRALSHAKTAIAADPSLAEGHLQAAISYALWGANTAAFKSLFSNLPGRARAAIDDALALEPENPWALSTSAAWRLEVHRLGGGAVYNADPALGYREFLSSREHAPQNVAVAYECALRFLASGRSAWRADAMTCLNAALILAPETQFERDLQARARMLRRATDIGDAAISEFVSQYG